MQARSIVMSLRGSHAFAAASAAGFTSRPPKSPAGYSGAPASFSTTVFGGRTATRSASGFTPRMIAQLKDKIRQRAERIADRVADKGGEVEFVGDVAQYLPLQMICDLVGVPEDAVEGRKLLALFACHSHADSNPHVVVAGVQARLLDLAADTLGESRRV